MLYHKSSSLEILPRRHVLIVLKKKKIIPYNSATKMMSLIPPIIQPMAAILFILISLTSAQSMQDTSAPETLSGTTTDPNTIKILVCGDSISQGIDGDFTWRYRLWEWFQKNALESPPPSQITTTQTTTPTLHYVGPYNGTLPTTVGDDVDLNQPQTWGTYHETVDPAFWPGGGSHHFAVYGRPAWMDIDLVGEQVTTYGPDLVILHMGFNDIGWWSQTAAELIETVSKLVWNIRMARSDVKILVADVSHRMQVTGRDDIPRVTDEYNGMLREKVLEWSTTESPVVAVKVSEEYGCELNQTNHYYYCHYFFFFLSIYLSPSLPLSSL